MNVVDSMVSLEPSDIQLVRQTFAMVYCVSTTASQLLFARLFELDPSLRAHFDDNLHSHRVKFMASLRVLLDALDNPQALRSLLQRLATIHAEYEIQPEQYDALEEAFLWMLHRTLGRSFTPEVQKAWRNTYALLAAQIQDAAQHQALS